MSSGKKELSETERTNLDIAQKTYDLLKQHGGGMTVKEIAGIITLPKTNLRMHERAQVGVAVKAHSETFTLSSMNSDGIVNIIRGAPRPGMYTVEGVSTQNTGTTSSRTSPSPPRDYSSDVVFKPPRRESADYMDDAFDRDYEGRWTNGDNGDPWSAGIPETDRQPTGSSRFSVPTTSGAPRRQPPDTYNAPRREEHFPRAPPSPPGYSSAQRNSFYDDQVDMNRGDYWKRDDIGRSRAERNDERENYPSYEEWKSKSRDQSANWQAPRAAFSSDRRPPPPYDDDADFDRQRRRHGVPPEPKKFECKHSYLTNTGQVPCYESVKLTHFVALDEFYVRSCKEENRYQDMLAKLREDYKGALEDAVPQLWMKGDGAAVWYERRWQRAVVRRPATSPSVTSVELFLIDVGKTITVSCEQVVPLHEYYHVAPFAYCCTIGCFDIVPGRRKAFLDECDDMAICFAEAVGDDLEVQIKERFYDETEKLKVRLIYRDRASDRPRDIVIPKYFVDADLVTLR
ncbi:hypothetical protein Y032_0346g3129 [Ancylostoma ceylanicum]|uniref:Tudor domain-containing protein n=1 Tax=Ancylostoma ceylanicum TaxID=53326 RepID=A0A016RX95_9BILA|nr:hypothetical protein Y032_0346g3129 [Ancylostoma ceylanicum]